MCLKIKFQSNDLLDSVGLPEVFLRPSIDDLFTVWCVPCLEDFTSYGDGFIVSDIVMLDAPFYGFHVEIVDFT